ncbi:MAG: tyrosine-protein phosphatase [Clostridiales bacterium]|nr:tyrosine-protein phosphatase [Clostridiales bacterium]
MSNYDVNSQLVGFEGLLNDRELGGMPLKDGRTFKKGIAIRSDSPSELTPDQAKAVRDYGVTQVIDLRSEAEVRRCGNPFIDMPGVNFINIPLFLGDPDKVKDPVIDFLRTHKLGHFYIWVITELPDRLIRVLRLIKDNEGITLYHCLHGKDRTGIVTAFLYLLAGASREDIIKNYASSFEFMKPILIPAIENIEPGLKHILNSDAENMNILLDYLDEHYDGNIESYLIQNGMTEEEIRELKEKIVE